MTEEVVKVKIFVRKWVSGIQEIGQPEHKMSSCDDTPRLGAEKSHNLPKWGWG